MRTVREVVPPIAKPANRMLPPVPTWTRAERLMIRGVAAVKLPAGRGVVDLDQGDPVSPLSPAICAV